MRFDHISITRLADILPSSEHRRAVQNVFADEFTGYPLTKIRFVGELREIGAARLADLFPQIDPEAWRWVMSQIGGAKRGRKPQKS